MAESVESSPEAQGARLSIGALSSATGIPVETLRTWEARYGFPVPERKPSGHRVYPLASIPRLRRIAEAIARGHRAGQVVPASDSELAALLQLAGPAPAPAQPGPAPDEVAIDELVRYVGEFAAEPLTRALMSDWGRLGPLRFVESRVAPLVKHMGEAWASGQLDVRHEHFVSERLEDLMRSLRFPLEERAQGPLVVLAALPGERHALGLQMAALVFVTAGCRILYLGPDCPLAEMVAIVADVKARVLALSVSRASAGANSNGQIRRLRKRLPRRMTLLVGGDGAPPAATGIEVIQDLRTLDAWARRLEASGR